MASLGAGTGCATLVAMSFFFRWIFPLRKFNEFKIFNATRGIDDAEDELRTCASEVFSANCVNCPSPHLKLYYEPLWALINVDLISVLKHDEDSRHDQDY